MLFGETASTRGDLRNTEAYLGQPKGPEWKTWRAWGYQQTTFTLLISRLQPRWLRVSTHVSTAQRPAHAIVGRRSTVRRLSRGQPQADVSKVSPFSKLKQHHQRRTHRNLPAMAGQPLSQAL